MKILCRLGVIFMNMVIAGCTMTEPSCPPPCSPLAKKNPSKIAFYLKNPGKKTYSVIGEESICKFNSRGNKRQEASLRHGMRELAAAMGGDAIINIKNEGRKISGTVVVFENKHET